MKLIFITLAGLVGIWLGWYYGLIVGYSLWPKSEWIGGAFSYLIGIPIGALPAAWLAKKALRKSRNRSAS